MKRQEQSEVGGWEGKRCCAVQALSRAASSVRWASPPRKQSCEPPWMIQTCHCSRWKHGVSNVDVLLGANATKTFNQHAQCTSDDTTSTRVRQNPLRLCSHYVPSVAVFWAETSAPLKNNPTRKRCNCFYQLRFFVKSKNDDIRC